MNIENNDPLSKELLLRSKIFERCSICRHYSVRYEDDYCFKHEAWIYGCKCKIKARYLKKFGLSEEDLNWDISL